MLVRLPPKTSYDLLIGSRNRDSLSQVFSCDVLGRFVYVLVGEFLHERLLSGVFVTENENITHPLMSWFVGLGCLFWQELACLARLDTGLFKAELAVLGFSL